MKKLIAALLTLILCFAPVTAFARTPLFDTTQLMMGDANEDGKVNAGDARTVLRIASKLEKSDTVNLHGVDADGNGTLNASDARIILRVAAGISEFVYGFDGAGIPCALNVLKGDKYYLEATYKDEATASDISISLAKDGENLFIISDDMGFDMSDLGFSKIGMMINDNKIYAIFGGKSSTTAMYIPDSMSEEMGMTKEDIIEMTDLINAFISDDIDSAERVTLNNESVFRYSYELQNMKYYLIVGENGKILRIDAEEYNGEITTLINFVEVSFDAVDEYFDLNNYDLM